MSNRNNGSTLKSFILGAAVGAIAGLLYAPEEGEKIRKKLKKNLDEGREKVKKVSEEAREKAKELSQEASKEFETLREKAEEKVDKKKKPARPRKFKGV